MTISRRTWLSSSVAAGAALVGAKVTAAGQASAGQASAGQAEPPSQAPVSPAPSASVVSATRETKPTSRITVPNGTVAPYRMRNGVKVFHIVAEPIEHEFLPGLRVKTWGYNGGTPGPVIEAWQGDRVRIYVTNKLPELTTIHWHGVVLPNGMDGVAGLTQPGIAPGQTYRYEFTLRHAGTFMYHPHADEMTQIALGMVGMIVVHPRGEWNVPRLRDYALLTHQWKIPIGARRPDPMAMNDWNVLTFNSKAFPATEPLIAEVGDTVRLRIGNLGPMDHHSVHMHGHWFTCVATDGGPTPMAARLPETTVLVPTGGVRVMEFTATEPGDWPMHCHMTHHGMNQMGHDIANLIGADVRGLDAKVGRVVPGYMVMGNTGMGGMDEMNMPQPDNSVSMRGGRGPFGLIDMGGMFTLIKVREKIRDAAAARASWYDAPAGTRARVAAAEELAADGIEVG